jgi:hypothetical protein
MSQIDDEKTKSIMVYSGSEGSTTSDSIYDQMVIVYDPLKQVVFEDYISNVTSVQYVQVPIKGRRNQVDVFLEIGPKKAKIFLATVDLSRLGFHTKWQRKRGKIEHIYVLGQIPDADGALEPVSHSIPSSPEI